MERRDAVAMYLMHTKKPGREREREKGTVSDCSHTDERAALEEITILFFAHPARS